LHDLFLIRRGIPGIWGIFLEQLSIKPPPYLFLKILETWSLPQRSYCRSAFSIVFNETSAIKLGASALQIARNRDYVLEVSIEMFINTHCNMQEQCLSPSHAWTIITLPLLLCHLTDQLLSRGLSVSISENALDSSI
jgi:hypothetical protein